MSDNPKELIFDEEARAKLRQGVRALTDVVGPTLGPIGKHVGLDSGWGAPKITSDGGAIAGWVELKDPYENMGASIGKEVATKMKEACGDGTTTSLLLFGSLVEQGIKTIASGASPILVKRGIEKGVEAILAQLGKGASSIEKGDEIREVATASASGSEEVGKMIAEAFEAVGKSGVITIEEAKGTETSLEIVEGMQFDKGYCSAYFCTNNEKMVCEMHKPRILVTDKKISSIQEILPLLQGVAAAGQEILIIADDIEGDALSTLVVNRLRGTLKVCAVKAPGFGDRRKSMLQDIAILTGATLVSDELGTSLKEGAIQTIGGADKVIITKDHTTIVHGEGSAAKVKQRIRQIEGEISEATSDYDRDKLRERIAKLSTGVAILLVGGETESVLKQKKGLYEDSLNSTRAAIEGGVVVGGGVALLRAAQAAMSTLSLTADEAIGAKIALTACTEPFKRLVQNSGFDPSLYLDEILSQKGNVGFNVQSGKVEDLDKAKIRDPWKVPHKALAFAASAAGVVILSECLIAEAAEEPS